MSNPVAFVHQSPSDLIPQDGPDHCWADCATALLGPKEGESGGVGGFFEGIREGEVGDSGFV